MEGGGTGVTGWRSSAAVATLALEERSDAQVKALALVRARAAATAAG